MPEELWKEVDNTVQEAVMKTTPMKKKHKKAKWLSEENFQIAEKVEKWNSKEKRNDISIWNAEFQRIESREKKYISSDQDKCIEENNRMGKTGDLFKKIRDATHAYLYNWKQD